MGPKHHQVPATTLRAGASEVATGRLYPQKTERGVAEPPAWTFFFVYSVGEQAMPCALERSWPWGRVPARLRAPGVLLLQRRGGRLSHFGPLG